MNIELKQIAESKVRQLGGDVCGVLVRTEDGGVMAVSEHGRCTRLDVGVMGPADPVGMSERELFEQRFPAPAGIYWNEISEQYDALPGAAGFDDVEIYHGQWMGWQAARAQSGQEVVGWVMPSAMKNDGLNFTADKKLAESWMKFSSEVTPVYIRPAQQDPDLQLIHERDHWEEKATELAEDVGKLLGVEVGEHSSANCPVQNAIDAVFRATEYPAQQGSVPDWMAEISENLQAQDNRMTADPLFVVFQKSEIVVDEDYQHDRIVWVDDEGNEADPEIADQLNGMRSDPECRSFMENEIELGDEDRQEWRRLAIVEADKFVTACFTESGAEAYLKRDGHNLNKPFIYAASLYRNEEMKQLREWLMDDTPQPQGDGWIKCSEVKPPHNECVDAWVEIPAGHHNGDAQRVPDIFHDRETGEWWHWDEGCIERQIVRGLTFTHWMKRPQPPVEQEGE